MNLFNENNDKVKENNANNNTKKYAFYCHKECEYFPCHKGVAAEQFNCLFCYCPLYALGDKCGGNFRYTKAGYKDCTDCTFPHIRENYDRVIERYGEIAKLSSKSSKL